MKRILIAVFCMTGSILLAQNMEISALLDSIESRKDRYIEYESYTAMAHATQNQMDKQWQPKKTVIVEKKIIYKDGKRFEDIMKAREIKKGREKDVTEEKRKEEMKRRHKMEKEEQKRRKEEEQGEEDGHEHGSFALALQDIFPFVLLFLK